MSTNGYEPSIDGADNSYGMTLLKRVREMQEVLVDMEAKTKILKERYAIVLEENEKLRRELMSRSDHSSNDDLELASTARPESPKPDDMLAKATDGPNIFYHDDTSKTLKEQFAPPKDRKLCLLPQQPSPTLAVSSIGSREQLAESDHHSDVLSQQKISEYSQYPELVEDVAAHHQDDVLEKYLLGQKAHFNKFPTEAIFEQELEEYKDVDCPSFFTHGLLFNPEHREQTYRTVLIDGLPPTGVSLQTVMKRVRTGPVYSAQILHTQPIVGTPSVLITFIFAQDAEEFIRLTQASPFKLRPHHKAARVALLSSPAYPMNYELADRIFNVRGITRAFLITRLPHHFTAAILHSELQLVNCLRWGFYDWVQEIAIADDCRSAVIVFESIPTAWRALQIFMTRFVFSYCNFSFIPDPCGPGPSKQPLCVIRTAEETPSRRNGSKQKRSKATRTHSTTDTSTTEASQAEVSDLISLGGEPTAPV